MKKLLTALLAIATALSLSACGNSQSESASTNGNTPSESVSDSNGNTPAQNENTLSGEIVDISVFDSEIDQPRLDFYNKVDNDIRIGWTERYSGEITGLQILRGTSEDSNNYEIIKTVGVENYALDQYCYIDKGMANKGYSYRVRFINGDKVGETATSISLKDLSHWAWYSGDSGYMFVYNFDDLWLEQFDLNGDSIQALDGRTTALSGSDAQITGAGSTYEMNYKVNTSMIYNKDDVGNGSSEYYMAVSESEVRILCIYTANGVEKADEVVYTRAN